MPVRLLGIGLPLTIAAGWLLADALFGAFTATEALVVAIVLAFSYFAPALGAIGPGPVQSSFHTNCGRFGYGYHGGKHLFVCPNRPFPGRVPPGAANPSGAVRNPEPVRSASGVSVASGVGQVAGSAAGRLSSGGAVPAGASQWRAFTELLLRELN